MHFLRTIFRNGFIHIINYRVCVHGNDGTRHPLWLDVINVFLTVFGQQRSSMAHRNNMSDFYQNSAVKRYIHCWFWSLMGFVASETNTECHQTYLK